MNLTFAPFVGAKAAPHIDELGQLRISVFRDFPYLYDGDLQYERKYLERYFESENSFVVLCLDDKKIVGAATGLPLIDEGEEFREPLEKAGYAANEVFYFGESVLLKPYRGFGAGKEFFKFREAHARTLDSIKYLAFCGVTRENDHPLRPAAYQPLDGLWTKMGFKKAEGVATSFSWKDIDQRMASSKPMQFWTKALEEVL